MDSGVEKDCVHTGKLIIGKLSECIEIDLINSDKFIGSDKLSGNGLRLNSDKFIGFKIAI